MSFDPIWSLGIIEGSYAGVVVGKESGKVEKFRVADLKGKAMLSLMPHTSSVTGVVPIPGTEEAYTVSTDGTIKLLSLVDDESQLEDGRRQTKSIDCGTPLRCAALSSDTLCCGASCGTLCIVREEGVDKLKGHKDAISCIHTIGESVVATGSYDNQIRVWDIALGATLFILMGHSSQVKTVTLIGGGSGLISTGRDSTLRLWVIPEASEPEEDPEGEATANLPKIIQCSSILNLPASPMCAVVPEEADNKLFVGLSGGASLIVAGGKLFNEVTEFTTRNGLEVKMETKRLQKLLKVKSAAAKKQFTKEVRAFKKTLLLSQDAEKAEQAAIRRAELRENAPQDHDDDEEVEEDEVPVEEEEEEVEEGEIAELSEERVKELQDFKEAKRTEMTELLAGFSTKVTGRISELAPLASTKFERSSAEIQRLSTVRYFPHSASDTLMCASYVPSGKILAGVGGSLSQLDCKAGVLSL